MRVVQRICYCFVALWLVLVNSADGALKTIFNDTDTALRVYENAFESGDALQLATVLSFMKSRFTEVLRSPLLLDLNEYAVMTLLAKNWIVEETEVFKAVTAYVKKHTEMGAAIKQALINQIHFVALHPSDLEKEEFQIPDVLPQRTAFKIAIFLAEGHSRIGDMFRYPNQLARRNVALESMGAQLLENTCKGHFFEDHLGERDTCLRREYHVKLGAAFLVSRINVEVLYHDVVTCILVDTSLDGEGVWEETVVKGLRYFSVQFEPKRIRHIRIRGCDGTSTTFGIANLLVSKPVE